MNTLREKCALILRASRAMHFPEYELRFCREFLASEEADTSFEVSARAATFLAARYESSWASIAQCAGLSAVSAEIERWVSGPKSF